MSETGPRSVVAAFEQRTGRRPDGLWMAPGRVNLIGEHTDYNDGYVLPAAIRQRAVVAAGRRPDDRFRCWSLQMDDGAEVPLADIGPGRASGWSAYPQGAAWALMRRRVSLAGADVVVDSDVRPGAGLSSSAALLCAVAVALADLHDAGLDRVELALAAQEAEQTIVRAPVGVMDHMAAMLGRAGHALFVDTRTLDHEAIPLGLDREGLRLAVIDTGVAHRVAGGAYGERRAACEDAARVLGVAALRDASVDDIDSAADRLGPILLRRGLHVVTENARVLEAVRVLREGRPGEMGPLLAASHASLRDDFEVSVPELDVAVSASCEGGALGARLTGAGFGGSALALVPSSAYDGMREHVLRAFATAGFAEPSVFTVETGDGAGRVAVA
ncbi:MAG TPA: galactokinase [Acidimicrobiales bacterium]|nr:galactokinase [Acidimicrobiales bacterium]